MRPSTTTSRNSDALPRANRRSMASTGMIWSRSRRSRSMVTKSAGAPGTSSPVPGAPVAFRPLATARAKKFGARPGALEAEAAVDHLHQPHLAQHVVVLVERQPIDADRDGAAALVRGGDRREAGAQMQVGTEIGDDARAGGGDHLDLVGPGVDAMRQRQPLRQEADVAEIANDAFREMLVGPGALIDGLQQMHVDAPAGQRRILGDRLQQRLRAPLHAGRAKLHVDLGTRDRRGDRVRQLDIGFRRHRRADEQLLDRLAIVAGETGQHRFTIAVHDRILVAHRKRKRDADTDVGRRARDRPGLLDQRHGAARAGVMDHHRRAAGPRRTRQRGGRGQIGIDRRAERGAQDPAFQRHAERAERGRGRPRVVVGVDEGREARGSAGRMRAALPRKSR